MLFRSDESLKKNMCIQDPVPNSDVSDDDCINPTLQYACVSWHVHLVEVHTTPADEPQIDRALKKFMEEKLLFWLEVLSILGAVRNAAEAMRATVDWLNVCCVPALPKFTQTVSRSHQRLSSLTTVFIKYFEVIKASASHIYHSALVSAPKKSIVRELYKSLIHPFVRVVHGLPASWDSNIATTMCPYQIGLAVWSTCNRFIATSWGGSVAVLDSATLQRLHTLEFPRGLSTYPRNLVFSPDSRILTCFSDHYAEQSVISWDLQTGSLLGVIRPESDIMEYRNVVKTAITYSADGKMVGVCQAYFYGPVTTYIAIFDIASGVSKQSYSINGGEIMFENNI